MNRENELTEGIQLLNNSKLCSNHLNARSLGSNAPGSGNSNNNNNVGGPLMSVTASQLNGQAGALSNSSSSSSSSSTSGRNSVTGYPGAGSSSGTTDGTALLGSSTSHFNQFNPTSMDMDFDLFPTSSLDMDGSSGFYFSDAVRPESRTSQASGSQMQTGQAGSRPPSQPNASSASPQGGQASVAVPAHCSPLRAFSPSTAHAFGNSFSFSPLHESQTASLGSTPSGNLQQPSPLEQQRSIGPVQVKQEHDQQQQQQSQSSLVSTESGRLRNLLTKGSSTSDDSCQDNATAGCPGQSATDADKSGQNRILKILLNQQDEDDYHSSDFAGSKCMRSCASQPVQIKTEFKTEPKTSGKSGNNMLLQVCLIY